MHVDHFVLCFFVESLLVASLGKFPSNGRVCFRRDFEDNVGVGHHRSSYVWSADTGRFEIIRLMYL